jgi:hypothetical protein
MRAGWSIGLRVVPAALLAALGLGGTRALAAVSARRLARNPAHNFPIGRLPLACIPAPSSPACIRGAVYWLDRARASLHQNPYRLPSDFASLSPAEQVFILTNLDRIRYGLAPIPGLTRQLNRWAWGGVRSDHDPASGDSQFAAASNWAFGFRNIVVAYEEWMYNDGYGGGNLDCTSPNAPDCWAHRHSVLWRFGAGGRLAMGAAAGYDRRGRRSYAMILGRGTGGFVPSYYYTWIQAVAAGAGTNDYVVHRPPAVALEVHGHGLKLVTLIAAPNAVRARCRVSKRRRRRWVLFQSWHCYPGRSVIGEAARGLYRFRLTAHGLTMTRYVALR